MKKAGCILAIIFFFGVISSCGIYKQPCEGVTSLSTPIANL